MTGTTAPYAVTAVILAGGKGQRLQGQDKGLLRFGQRRIIEILLDQVIPEVSELFINANRNQKIYASYGYPVISDVITGFQGPLAGFSVAMEKASTSHILTLPCDGPYISAEYVNRMCQHLSRQATDALDNTIAVAHDGERLQPVHALIPVVLLDHLNNFLQTGNRKTSAWYAQHSIHKVDFSDQPELFRNINTQEQLNTLEQLHHA